MSILNSYTLLTSSSSSRTLFIQKHMAMHMSTAPEATKPTPMYRTAGTGFVWWSASPSQLNRAPMHTSVMPNRYGRCDSSGTISAISGCVISVMLLSSTTASCCLLSLCQLFPVNYNILIILFCWLSRRRQLLLRLRLLKQ